MKKSKFILSIIIAILGSFGIGVFNYNSYQSHYAFDITTATDINNIVDDFEESSSSTPPMVHSKRLNTMKVDTFNVSSTPQNLSVEEPILLKSTQNSPEPIRTVDVAEEWVDILIKVIESLMPLLLPIIMYRYNTNSKK